MLRQSFNRGWSFNLGGTQVWRWRPPDFTDWRTVDLPHDWSIELDRSPQEASSASGGYFPTGLGWYFKTFLAPPDWQGKKVWVEFEGVYMNAEAWLNGHFLGRHPYGYTSFRFDLTPYLQYGEGENILRVIVDNAGQLNSRWYSGSGIYRPVWLLVSEPVHIDHWGVYASSSDISSEAALVRVNTSLNNESEAAAPVTLRSAVLAPDGTLVTELSTLAYIPAGEQHEAVQELQVPNPRLWSPDSPRLYSLISEVSVDGRVVDTTTTPFGIRSLRFDARNGFRLNGVPLKLKGGCVHHDDGILGSASYPRSEERKVELLKASGFNAIRCAHNPPAPAFLDACDRLGMLVIDEAFDCWRDGKNPYDYHVVFDDWWQRDVESMVFRDRNHPSIILWSIGNELVERGLPEGAEIARRLVNHIHALDSTRPVTAAVNGFGELWPWSRSDGIFAELDVCGYNYQWAQYRSDHELHPERMIVGTESFPMEAFENWMSVLEQEHVLGDFVWTSLDYLGESGIGRVYFGGEEEPFLGAYPWHQANCGDLDLCGFKRPQSYYRDVVWGNGEKLYIAVHTPLTEGQIPTISRWGWPDVWPDWTWTGYEGQELQVDVYSACEQVELFLNGRSLGVKPTTRQEKLMATFSVPYEPGVLKAVGSVNGQPVVEREVRTACAPASIRLTPDRTKLRAGPEDLCYVTVEVMDAEGFVHPRAENEIFFTVQGAGKIAAVGNGNPVSEERYRGNQRKAFHGRCLVVVKSAGQPGEVCLRAQADGMEGAEVTILCV